MPPRHRRRQRHDRDKRGRSDPFSNESDSDGTGAGVGPSGMHEAFWDQIHRSIDERVLEFAPTTATVMGMDGGRVKVHLDDEDDPREIGFSRRKGTRYDDDERVLVGKTRGGRQIVLGTFTDKTGYDERGVANEDMHDDAIDNRLISENAVQGYNITDGSIDQDHIQGQSIRGDHIQSGQIQASHIINKQIGWDHLEGRIEKDLKDSISEATKAMNLIGNDSDQGMRGDIKKLNQEDSDIKKSVTSVKGTADSAKDKADSADNKVDDLKSRVDELEKKVKRLGGSSS
jgi:hypothetical protein